MHINIKTELVEAMRAKDSIRVSVLRNLIAAFTNELVAKGKKPQDEITEDEALAVIKRQVKQRKDSIEQFRKGNREDLVEREEAELKILERYLPAQMNREEIKKIALPLKEKMGADKSKMGMFMGALMKELKGQADGSDVKAVVEEILA